MSASSARSISAGYPQPYCAGRAGSPNRPGEPLLGWRPHLPGIGCRFATTTFKEPRSGQERAKRLEVLLDRAEQRGLRLGALEGLDEFPVLVDLDGGQPEHVL